MATDLFELHCRLNSIVIFRDLLECRTMQSLDRLLTAADNESDLIVMIKAYSDFVSNLFRHHNDLAAHIRTLVLENKNIYIINKARNIPVSEKIEECVENELKVLGEIAELTPHRIKESIGYNGFLPEWDNSPIDLSTEYKERVENIDKYGYGIYSKYYMFIVKDSKILPVKYPDEIKLSDLIGYRQQRKMIIDNTLALVNGKPALNVLLTGDAGTGKSSTVKAIANEYRDRGLRIIELRKDQLRDIPMIIDDLSRDPLKFILFIDDLSFASDDENFAALKAILEGSVSARADNIAIYATSNRRHLVKERFSDRDGDDIHRNDTIQELISLSERFGLHITFSKPTKAEYFDIVSSLADKHGIDISKELLQLKAESFAMSKSGRSARAAKQFIDTLIARGD